MQDILSLLSQSLSDMAIIAENIRATNAMEADIVEAIGARIEAEALKDEYRRFCDDCRRDLDPIEQECLGLPTFREWKEANGHV